MTEPPRGRPRDSTRDVAIHKATLDLLKHVGYDDLSVEAIAAKARVSKATIYRRWPNKAAIVAAAVEQEAGSAPPQAQTGSLRSDLVEVLGWLAEDIAEQDMAMIAAVLAGMRSDRDLATALRGKLHRDRTAMIGGVLEQATRRGEPLNPHAEALFSEIAPAVIVHRLLIVGEHCDGVFLEHLVDEVLLPLLHRT